MISERNTKLYPKTQVLYVSAIALTEEAKYWHSELYLNQKNASLKKKQKH